MTVWDVHLKALYRNAKAKSQPKKKQQDDNAMQVDVIKLQKLTDAEWEKNWRKKATALSAESKAISLVPAQKKDKRHQEPHTHMSPLLAKPVRPQ